MGQEIQTTSERELKPYEELIEHVPEGTIGITNTNCRGKEDFYETPEFEISFSGKAALVSRNIRYKETTCYADDIQDYMFSNAPYEKGRIAQIVGISAKTPEARKKLSKLRKKLEDDRTPFSQRGIVIGQIINSQIRRGKTASEDSNSPAYITLGFFDDVKAWRETA